MRHYSREPKRGNRPRRWVSREKACLPSLLTWAWCLEVIIRSWIKRCALSPQHSHSELGSGDERNQPEVYGVLQLSWSTPYRGRHQQTPTSTSVKRTDFQRFLLTFTHRPWYAHAHIRTIIQNKHIFFKVEKIIIPAMSRDEA